jgi:hypothetical protein
MLVTRHSDLSHMLSSCAALRLLERPADFREDAHVLAFVPEGAVMGTVSGRRGDKARREKAEDSLGESAVAAATKGKRAVLGEAVKAANGKRRDECDTTRREMAGDAQDDARLGLLAGEDDAQDDAHDEGDEDREPPTSHTSRRRHHEPAPGQGSVWEGDDPIWGSMIKQAIKRRNPGFNERAYGFRSFNDLLLECQKRNLLKLDADEKSGGYVVRLAE